LCQLKGLLSSPDSQCTEFVFNGLQLAQVK
jgi:hypothetical protein